ncbi:hypothetical protein BGZ94_005882, partial [Podila epigama]
MSALEAELFRYAVDGLRPLQQNPAKARDGLVLSDVHIAASCVLNTMSAPTCRYMEEVFGQVFVQDTMDECKVPDMDQHP